MRAPLLRSFRGFVARFPGVDGDALLRAAGIAPDQLEPTVMLSWRRCVELLAAAARATGDGAFGLGYAAQLPWKDVGVLGYVMLHSPTIGAAFRNARRYFAVQHTLGGLTLEAGPTRARLRYVVDDPAGAHEQGAQIVLAVFTRLCREGVGNPGWTPLAIHLRHRPRITSAHERFFRCPILVGKREDAMILPSADLRTPLRTADPDLLPILLRHADECLARLPRVDDFLAEVRRAVIDSLGTGDVTIERIAERLATSPRSLQRRLRSDDRSFSNLVAETRLALARRYLADPALSLTECAFLLGYSDLSAFSRAYKRWTGRSPGARQPRGSREMPDRTRRGRS